MVLSEARTELKKLVDVTTSPTLSDDDLDAALAVSKIKDSEGRPPSHPAWVPSYNFYWAAAAVSDVRVTRSLSQEQLTEVSSEGSRFKITAIDWSQVAQAFRDQAVKHAGLSGSGISVIVVDRRLMNGRPRSGQIIPDALTNETSDPW